MTYKIKATNKHNGNVIEYEIEGNPTEGFCYIEDGVPTHLQEVKDNTIREVNNTLILQDSPLYTIKAGETETTEAMSFDIEIKA